MPNRSPSLPVTPPIATRFGRSGSWVWVLMIWQYPDNRYCYVMKINTQLQLSGSTEYPLLFGSFGSVEDAIAAGLEDVAVRLKDAPIPRRRN